MHQPASAATHVQYADVLYTIGGAANYQTARTHYSAAIEISSGQNARALYGLCATSAQLRKGDSRVSLPKPKLSTTNLPISLQQTSRIARLPPLCSQATRYHSQLWTCMPCRTGKGRCQGTLQSWQGRACCSCMLRRRPANCPLLQLF